jgi:hypothetical protein
LPTLKKPWRQGLRIFLLACLLAVHLAVSTPLGETS